IELNVSAIEHKKEGLSDRQFVTGVIHYENVDKAWKNSDGQALIPEVKPGVILYIKPSLIGKEMADVLNYRKTEATFPHESTADQFFDEAQFESYRTLGYQIGQLAFGKGAFNDVPEERDYTVEALADALYAQCCAPEKSKAEA
ncbi:MAG: hypothetical protein HYZ45_03180, partial [Burkholderiales bacterium]|nr:hypothetical protein [Burkholderiales bacterium]